MVCLCVRTHLSLPCVYVCLFFKKKGNCPSLLKRVCYVQYNLPHPLLKVTMAFEWSCSALLCQNIFPSLLHVCVRVCFKKKKNGIIVPHCLRKCVMWYNLPHHSLKVTMTFEWSCNVSLCQNHFPSPLCMCVCFSKKRIGNCPTLLKRVCCVQYNLFHPPLKVTMAFEWSCGVPLCQNSFPSPLSMCVCVCLFLKRNPTLSMVAPRIFFRNVIKKFKLYKI